MTSPAGGVPRVALSNGVSKGGSSNLPAVVKQGFAARPVVFRQPINPLLVKAISPSALTLQKLNLPTAQLILGLRNPQALNLAEVSAEETMAACLELLLDPETILDTAALQQLPESLVSLSGMPAYQPQVLALAEKAYLLPESAFIGGQTGTLAETPELFATTLIGGRKNNEDGMLVMVDPQGRQYYLVADGMGGHGHGEIASKMAIQLVYGYLANAPEITPKVIEQAIAFANAIIFNYFPKTNRHPGTTLVGTIIDGDRVYTWGVGDSTVYGIAVDGSIRMLNKPDSFLVYCEELSGFQLSLPIAGKQLEELEARLENSAVKNQSNIVTAAVGFQAQGKAVAVQEITLLPGEMLLLASDGLTGALGSHPSAKLRELRQVHQTPAALGAALKELLENYFREHPKADNATFVLVDPAKMVEIEADKEAPLVAEPLPVSTPVASPRDPLSLLIKPKRSLTRRVLTAAAGVAAWGGVTAAISLQTWSSFFANLTQLSHLSNLEIFVTTNALVGGGLIVLTGLGYLAARAAKGLYLYFSETGATREMFAVSPTALYLAEGYRSETVRQLLPGQKEYLALVREAITLVLLGNNEERAEAVRNSRLNGAILADLAAYYQEDSNEVNVVKVRQAAEQLHQEGLISETELLLVTLDPYLVTDRKSAANELKPFLSYPITSVRQRAQAALALLNQGPVVDRRNSLLQGLSLERSPQDQLQALRLLVASINKKELAPAQIEEAKKLVQAMYQKYEEMSTELQEALLAAAEVLNLPFFTDVEIIEDLGSDVEIIEDLGSPDPSGNSGVSPLGSTGVSPLESTGVSPLGSTGVSPLGGEGSVPPKGPGGSITAQIRALQAELDGQAGHKVEPGTGAVQPAMISVQPEVGNVAVGAAGVLPTRPVDAAKPEATGAEAIAAVSEVARIAQLLQDANQRMREINELLNDEDRASLLTPEVFGQLQQEVDAIAAQIADLLLDIDNADQLVNSDRRLKRDLNVFNNLRGQVLAELEYRRGE